MAPFSSPLRRLWQPQRPLFWLVVVFNVMSSIMGWALHLAQPTGVLLALLMTGALVNTALGWWLLARLWRETAPAPTAAPLRYDQTNANEQEP